MAHVCSLSLGSEQPPTDNNDSKRQQRWHRLSDTHMQTIPQANHAHGWGA